MSNELKLLEVIKKAKSRGYWKVVIEPIKDIETFFEHIADAKKIIEENRIQLRGWDYPHFPVKNEWQDIILRDGRVDGYISWDYFHEAWSYYDSGQFVHLFGFYEDWIQESNLHGLNDPISEVKPNTYLDYTGTVYRMTEIFLFLKNIITNVKGYGDAIHCEISLHNLEGRIIQTFDPGRVQFYIKYMASANDVTLVKKVFHRDELQSKTLELARTAVIDLFRYFEWDDPSIQGIEDDQLKLVEKRLWG